MKNCGVDLRPSLPFVGKASVAIASRKRRGPRDGSTSRQPRTSWRGESKQKVLRCEAGAFRYDASEVPESLPGVKVIRSFAKKVTKMEEAIEAGNVQEAGRSEARWRPLRPNSSIRSRSWTFPGPFQALEREKDPQRYLPLVELEPIDSQDYTHEWDTRPQVWCQGQFCV